MTQPPRNPPAGGFPILVGAIGGTLLGLHFHQVTAGFLIGIGIGIALAVAIWLASRRR